MARRTKEEAQQTRCHIMGTALNLFCQQGLAKTNLTDIAKAADLTRGAIYWHFKNKEELCAPLSHQIDACVDEQEQDPLGKLRGFLNEVMYKISTEPAHQQMFTIIFNLEPLEGEAEALRDHMRLQSINFFRDLEITLANAVRLGHLPKELDLRRAATLLHCTLDGYIVNWLHFPERIDLIKEADFLLDTLFGLLANPSPSLLRRP
ncbi:TetR family transcriptional regulator [Aeromonas media]|uniref:TetR family transcriptional regulator n=1 Tax=Aeromonas media TaxID=651 RepID=UPI001911D47B|nr:TetR family transcriptional regulator [Aeromonas media]QQQ12338.1 TetR family transcriptional regulator [Aeromonas media]